MFRSKDLQANKNRTRFAHFAGLESDVGTTKEHQRVLTAVDSSTTFIWFNSHELYRSKINEVFKSIFLSSTMLLVSKRFAKRFAYFANCTMHIAILRRRRNFVVYSVTVFLHLLFVISPEMIHKSSQMSARASVRVVSTQHFQNPRLLDRWANVDETRHIYSVGLGTKSRKRNSSEFGPLRRAVPPRT